MPPQPTSADRAAEFNRLIVEQGHVTRSMKYGWEPDDEQKAVIDARAIRLLELAELLPGTPNDVTPGRYVNDRLAAWMRANPLALGKRRVKQVIDDPASGNVDNGVAIQIGDPANGGYHYQALADDCANQNGILRFTVPEPVAEYFRQQGYRKRSREIASALGFKLDY